MKRSSRCTHLSEDWLAVIVGLTLVLLVALGVIGEIPWPMLGLFS